jgi:rhodanese-related sulfurtransferase
MNTLQQTAAVAAIALAGAGLTWRLAGPPDRSVPCEQSRLPAGEVCLATVTGEWGGEVVWVDARPRAEWQRDGLRGSILLTTHEAENFQDLVAAALERLAVAKRVVIYCSDSGCATSHEVAKQLRGFGIGPEYYVLHGGWRSLAAAGLVSGPN